MFVQISYIRHTFHYDIYTVLWECVDVSKSIPIDSHTLTHNKFKYLCNMCVARRTFPFSYTTCIQNWASYRFTVNAYSTVAYWFRKSYT